jgi:hypothetical protein
VKGQEWYQKHDIAEAYDEKRFSQGGRLIDRREKEAVVSALEPLDGKRVLEVACGTGRFTVMLAERGADIVGVDWNGVHLAALHGEYFSPHGYGSADHLSIRETVRESLRHIRSYWKSRGVWRTTETDRNPLTAEPMDPVWAADGLRATGDGLEDAIVVGYENGQTLAYRNQHERDRIEYRAGLTPGEVHT